MLDDLKRQNKNVYNYLYDLAQDANAGKNASIKWDVASANWGMWVNAGLMDFPLFPQWEEFLTHRVKRKGKKAEGIPRDLWAGIWQFGLDAKADGFLAKNLQEIKDMGGTEACYNSSIEEFILYTHYVEKKKTDAKLDFQEVLKE